MTNLLHIHHTNYVNKITGITKITYCNNIKLYHNVKCIPVCNKLDNHIKLQCMSNESHIFMVHMDTLSIDDSNWCIVCKENIKFNTKCKILASKRHGKLISTTISSLDDNLAWECENKHIFIASYKDAKDKWCITCDRIETHQNSKFDMKQIEMNDNDEIYSLYHCNDTALKYNGKCLSKKYTNINSRLTWQCINGHVWQATYKYILQGNWCKHCLSSKDTIKLDIYSLDDCHKLAQEYDGKCISSEYINMFNKLTWQCGKNHKWRASYNNILQGFWCARCKLLEQNRKILHKCHQLAEKYGGRCLTSGSLNNRRILWECKNKHKWKANLSIASEKWCNACNNKRVTGKYIFKDCKEIAVLYDGGCLPPETNIQNHLYSPLKWKCKMGHIWTSTLDEVMKNNWCSICKVDKKRKMID